MLWTEAGAGVSLASSPPNIDDTTDHHPHPVIIDPAYRVLAEQYVILSFIIRLSEARILADACTRVPY